MHHAHWSTAIGGALLLGGATACSSSTSDGGGGAGGAPEPLRIAVAMSAPQASTSDAGIMPDFEWALENINAAGGVAGRSLALEYIDPDGRDLDTLGTELANDARYVAAVAPPGSSGLQKVADAFVAARKPIVSPTSTSDDLLRAYGGDGAVWRTRESDIAQTELLVRWAKGGSAKRLTLLTSLDVSGYTFFTWFGFFARELGYAESDVNLVALPDGACDDALKQAVDTKPDILFVAAGNVEQLKCVAKGRPHGQAPGIPNLRTVFADTGLDAYVLESLGVAAGGLEGFSAAAADAAYDTAYEAKYPGTHLAPHGAGEYDAVLLLAYGLEVSGGKGGKTLIAAMKEAVSGSADGTHGWDADGVKAALAALRKGERPRLHGATGELVFEPELYMDLASSTLVHWKIGDQGLVRDARYWTGDPSFLTSQGAFVRPGVDPQDVDSSTWAPATAKSDTWAFVAALSSGWENYRHQADAHQQYAMLKASGVDDDHIVLVLADDLANAVENRLQGTVRNEPEGENLYPGIEVDYGVTLTVDQIKDILTSNVTAATPKVLHPTASSNIYIYLAGHGGTDGIPIDATTAEEGLAGGGATLSPAALRESLCLLSEQKSYRRVLAVIESCFSGAFGDAAYGGLELGCGASAGELPLEGVVLFTAANSKETSSAGAYDMAVPAWVDDAFSRKLADNALASPGASLADIYADTYRGTAGSHPSVYNAAYAGRLSLVPLSEFFSP
jgi:ABC-type branched-subunit amino acid transport system substrate-binding protein